MEFRELITVSEGIIANCLETGWYSGKVRVLAAIECICSDRLHRIRKFHRFQFVQILEGIASDRRQVRIIRKADACHLVATLVGIVSNGLQGGREF